MPSIQEMPQHIQWLATHRGQELQSCLQRQGVDADLAAALGSMMAADPSPGLHAVQWLCDTYIGGGYRWEDLAGGPASKVAQTLAVFAQHRGDLQPHQRNLQTYASLASLYQAYAPMLAAAESPLSPGSRSLRRLQRAQAYQDSIVVHHRPDLIVAVPLTRQAACWWGRGTRWCTAGDEQNMFEHYHKSAPLIVVTMPGISCNADQLQEGKLQLYLDPDGDVQFMDASDAPVRREFIDLHWDRLGPLLEWAIGIKAGILSYVPDTRLGHEHYLAAVQCQGRALRYIPDHMRLEDICLAAVKSDADAFRWVPERIRTPEVLAAMVSSNHKLFTELPFDYVDRQLCMIAIEQDGYNIFSAPSYLHDDKMYALALRTSGDALGRVPTGQRSHAMCLDAVQKSGTALRHVPMHLVDRQMCTLAVANDGCALEHVPPHLVDAEMSRIAVAGKGMALQGVLLPFCTPELCTLAVEADYKAMLYVPKKFKTPEFYMAYIERNGLGLPYIDFDDITPELRMAAVLQNPEALHYIRGEALSSELCMAAFRASTDIFSAIPGKFQTREMCLAAVEHDSLNMYYVSQDMLSEHLYVISCVQDAGYIALVPKHLTASVSNALDVIHELAPEAEPDANVRLAHDWSADTALAGLGAALLGAHQRVLEHETSLHTMIA